MTFGDTPFPLDEPQFTHGEAVEITGVPSKTLNNWTQREVIDLGLMHRTGRRLYSIYDLIQLKVIGDLVRMLDMPPSRAVLVGQFAMERAHEMSERDETGKLKYKGLAQEQRHYIVLWVDGDDLKIRRLADIKSWFTDYSVPHPTIVVPLDDIILRVQNTAFDVLEKEHGTSDGGAGE